MNTHTGHRLFSIRTIAVAVTIAVFGAMLPQTAAAQRASIGGIDDKLDEVLQGLCLLPSAPASCFTTRVVFVTSTRHTGDFGGVTGGDAICNSHAQAAHLPGVYRAWLSDRSGSPQSRFTQATVPYVRTDDVTVANDFADLTDGTLLAIINRDEHANPIDVVPFSASAVWTGTDPAGNEASIFDTTDCTSWTSLGTVGDPLAGTGQFGVTSSTGAQWTDEGSFQCVSALRIYCFQQ